MLNNKLEIFEQRPATKNDNKPIEKQEEQSIDWCLTTNNMLNITINNNQLTGV